MTEFDFESFWADLRPKRSEAQIVKDKASDFNDLLEKTCAKTAQDLTQKYQDHTDKPITMEILADIISTGARIFVEKWHENLRNQNLTGLIEFVLEDQKLSPDELLGFVRALPTRLLERISESAFGTATGTHGLMATEFARRNGEVRVYSLQFEEGRILVTFTDKRDRHVSFYLDDKFELPK